MYGVAEPAGDIKCSSCGKDITPIIDGYELVWEHVATGTAICKEID